MSSSVALGKIKSDDTVVQLFRNSQNKKIKKWPFVHFRRIFVIFVNWFLNHDYIFKAVGQLNRYFKLIESVVVIYPATQEYALSYVYKSHLSKMKWNPHPAGFIWQNGKLKILFVISAIEKDFVEPSNQENLKRFAESTEKLRKFLWAPEKRFAGILPGILLSQHLIDYSPELATEVEIIIQTEKQIRNLEKYESDVPLIILGGKGFIGKRLIERFFKDGRKIHCIDRKESFNKWPSNLQGKKAILINVSRKEALSQYIPFLWPELIVINEVYPEPNPEELGRLKKIGIRCYHIVGVKGKALPRFPYSYAGGVPCCLSHFVSGMSGIEIIFRRLT